MLRPSSSSAGDNDPVSPKPLLTTAAGAPVNNNSTSLTAGPRGPVLLQDVWLLEKLAHFDREVIPERRMHAKGSGAYGVFTVTHDISRFTKANLFNEVGKRTSLFVRFSIVAGERGAADAERDIRGVAFKFYTEEGNWDLVGNNTPVFFMREPIKFPDLNHAIKRDPQTNLRNPTSNWDFWTSTPEALHQVTITMSERGIPRSYRHMHAFGSHAFSMLNHANERVWVKFHFATLQGVENLTDAEVQVVIGTDRESFQRDLFNSIEQKSFPKWKMSIQVMTDEQARACEYNPFDLSKVWYKGEFPLIDVGVVELNRNPANYFAEVEQAAFNPANVVPGISFSPDKMLQARLFSYGDAQRYRLGVNHQHIPVNAPKCPVHSYHRDGAMRVDGNMGSTIGYEPNMFGEWAQQPRFKEPPSAIREMAVDGTGVGAAHWTMETSDLDFVQPGKLFAKMNPQQRRALFENTARSLSGVPLEIKMRHVKNCARAHLEYGKGVEEALRAEEESTRETGKL